MRHLLRSLPLLALVAAGCDRKPEDPIFVYGRLQHLDGSPNPDTTVTLERKVHTRSGFIDPEAGEFERYGESRSERSGAFTLEVLYGDSIDERLSDFTQYRFRVAAPLEEGHGVFSSFVFYDDAELPPLRPWEPQLTLALGTEGPELSFASAPPPPALPVSAKLPEIYFQDNGDPTPVEPLTPYPVLQLHGPGGRVWEAHDPTSPWQANPYLLEDFPGVEAQVRSVTLGSWLFYPLAANSSSVSFRVEWRGPRVPVPNGSLRPVSRGAPCVPSPTGAPCPYTDGSLLTVRTDLTRANSGVGNVTLAWETAVRPRRAVIRDLQMLAGFEPIVHVLVEGSADGASWSTLADVPYVNFDRSSPFDPVFSTTIESTEADSPYGDGPLDMERKARFLDVPLTGDAPVRQVRLQVKTENRGTTILIYALAELSIFE